MSDEQNCGVSTLPPGKYSRAQIYLFPIQCPNMLLLSAIADRAENGLIHIKLTKPLA